MLGLSHCLYLAVVRLEEKQAINEPMRPPGPLVCPVVPRFAGEGVSPRSTDQEIPQAIEGDQGKQKNSDKPAHGSPNQVSVSGVEGVATKRGDADSG